MMLGILQGMREGTFGDDLRIIKARGCREEGGGKMSLVGRWKPVNARSCTDYNFYLKDVRNFISQCSKRTTLNFDVETPLIEASKFKGDEFNVFFSKLQKFEVCIEVRYTKLKRIAFPAIREKARARCSGKLAAIVIRDNPYLEEIVFGKSNNVRANAIPTLMVRGNRKLTNNTINKLKQLKAGGRRSKRNTIQVYG
ncbi:hypothetical protein OSTOST_21242, partial [Ostertagia ostertagi]